MLLHKPFLSVLSCLSLLAAFLLAGCAPRPAFIVEEPAVSNGARQLARTAPTAEEMETPLGGNGGHDVVVRQHDDPVITESATVPVPGLRGSAFPGLNADMSQGPMTTDQARAATEPANLAPAAEARITALESELATLAGAKDLPAPQTIETQAELERRIRAMELRLAGLEGQVPPAPEAIPAQELEPRLERMEARLAKVQALTQEERQELLAQAQAAFDARVTELESQVARLENREPTPSAPAPDARIGELATRLQALESRQPAPEHIVRLEARLAQLEGLRIAEGGASASGSGLGPRVNDVHVAQLDAPAYRIGAGDVLEFYSFDEQTLNTEVTVRYDGHVSLPLIPDMQVANHTRAQAEVMFARCLLPTFFVIPSFPCGPGAREQDFLGNWRCGHAGHVSLHTDHEACGSRGHGRRPCVSAAPRRARVVSWG